MSTISDMKHFAFLLYITVIGIHYHIASCYGSDDLSQCQCVKNALNRAVDDEIITEQKKGEIINALISAAQNNSVSNKYSHSSEDGDLSNCQCVKNALDTALQSKTITTQEEDDILKSLSSASDSNSSSSSDKADRLRAKQAGRVSISNKVKSIQQYLQKIYKLHGQKSVFMIADNMNVDTADDVTANNVASEKEAKAEECSERNEQSQDNFNADRGYGNVAANQNNESNSSAAASKEGSIRAHRTGNRDTIKLRQELEKYKKLFT